MVQLMTFLVKVFLISHKNMCLEEESFLLSA